MVKKFASIFLVGLLGVGFFPVSPASAQTYVRNVTPVIGADLDLRVAPADHDIVLVTTGSEQRTVTLPTAIGNTGRHYTIKKVDAPPTGTGTVLLRPDPAANPAQNIDGQASYFLTTKDQEVRVVSDGTNWKILDAQPKEVLHAHTFPGANAGAKIAAACAALPAGGGTIDARGFGATTQTISTDIFLNCNKLLHIITNPSTVFMMDTGADVPLTFFNSGLRITGGATFRGRAGGTSTNSSVPALFSSNFYLTTGSATANSRSITVADATRFAPGRVVGILGAAGGSTLQERPLNATITAGALSLVVTGAAYQGWMRGNHGSVQDGAAMGCSPTCKGMLFIPDDDGGGPNVDEFIGYNGIDYVTGSNTTFTGLTRSRLGSAGGNPLSGSPHNAGAFVRQVFYHISEAESVSGTTVVLKDAATRTVSNAEVMVGVSNVQFDGITIDGNVHFEIKSISRTAGTVTVDTAVAHPFATGNIVYIREVPDATFNNESGVIVTVPNSTRFTYSQAGDASSAGGFAFRTTANINGIYLVMAKNVRVGKGVTVRNVGQRGIMAETVLDSEFDGKCELAILQNCANIFGSSQRSKIKGTHRMVGAGPAIEARSIEAQVWIPTGGDGNVIDMDLVDTIFEAAGSNAAWVEDASNTSINIREIKNAKSVDTILLIQASDQWVTNPTVQKNTATLGPVGGTVKSAGSIVRIASTVGANANNSVFLAGEVPAGSSSIFAGNYLTALSTVPPCGKASGEQQKGCKAVFGTVTLSAGAATVSLVSPFQFTSGTTYACSAADETAPNAVQIHTKTATSFQVAGIGSDVIAYTCIGN